MKKILMTAALMIAIFSLPKQTFAASEDDEISIMAAEQRITNEADVTVAKDKDYVETFDDKKSSSSENDNTNKNKTSIDKDKERNSKTENTIVNPDVMNPNVPEIVNSDTNAVNLKNATNVQTNGNSNTTATYNDFNDAAKKVGYVPLYIPRKSGYIMDNISVISNDITEIRYSKRWEPKVILSVRTYKRAVGEKLRDISGVNGVKWKIDNTSGTTIYIARINDTTSVAVWAVSQYTFAAMAENLSFAAFHSFIVEELIDICSHYFIDV